MFFSCFHLVDMCQAVFLQEKRSLRPCVCNKGWKSSLCWTIQRKTKVNELGNKKEEKVVPARWRWGCHYCAPPWSSSWSAAEGPAADASPRRRRGWSRLPVSGGKTRQEEPRFRGEQFTMTCFPGSFVLSAWETHNILQVFHQDGQLTVGVGDVQLDLRTGSCNTSRKICTIKSQGLNRFYFFLKKKIKARYLPVTKLSWTSLGPSRNKLHTYSFCRASEVCMF